MERPTRVRRYGKELWETTAMDILRREHCMCLHCIKLKPGSSDNCRAAQAFFEICKEHGNAFIMTRCASWEEIS